jgi:hypothetical protein
MPGQLVVGCGRHSAGGIVIQASLLERRGALPGYWRILGSAALRRSEHRLRALWPVPALALFPLQPLHISVGTIAPSDVRFANQLAPGSTAQVLRGLAEAAPDSPFLCRAAGIRRNVKQTRIRSEQVRVKNKQWI